MSDLPPVENLEMFSASAIVELKDDYSETTHNGITYIPKGSKGWTTSVWGKTTAEWHNGKIAGPFPANDKVTFFWMDGHTSSHVRLSYKDLKIVTKLGAWKEIAKHGNDFRAKN